MSEQETALQVVEEVPQDVAYRMEAADPLEALKRGEEVVKYMASKCTGKQFISKISGRLYPRVEWWTTVGAGLGLFPQEESSIRLDREGIAYEATVKVCHGSQVVSRASAICSTSERTWKNRDEYAIKSMATTRATGKAYRIAFSYLAVMAGLEGTPAEEMPPARDQPGTTPEPPRPEKDEKRQMLIDEIADVMTSSRPSGDPVFSDEELARVKEQIKEAKTYKELGDIRNTNTIIRDQRQPLTKELEKKINKGEETDGGLF